MTTITDLFRQMRITRETAEELLEDGWPDLAQAWSDEADMDAAAIRERLARL